MNPSSRTSLSTNLVVMLEYQYYIEVGHDINYFCSYLCCYNLWRTIIDLEIYPVYLIRYVSHGLKLSQIPSLSALQIQHGCLDSNIDLRQTNYVKQKADSLANLWIYRQSCNIRRTKSLDLNVSGLVSQLSLLNPLKPGLSREWWCSWSNADGECSVYQFVQWAWKMFPYLLGGNELTAIDPQTLRRVLIVPCVYLTFEWMWWLYSRISLQHGPI